MKKTALSVSAAIIGLLAGPAYASIGHSIARTIGGAAERAGVNLNHPTANIHNLNTPPSPSQGNHTPDTYDPGADILSLGEESIRLAIGSLGDGDLEKLKANCRTVLRSPQSFGPSIVTICKIVEDKFGGL